MACVLILEDDEISARLAARMLRMHGHEVHPAGRSSVAWTRLQEAPIDILLLDTELDGEHGWEFLARIRSDVVFKELPVVVYSSVSRRDVVQRYLTLGVQGILVKPATAERLNQEVDRVTRIVWRKNLFESESVIEARTGLLPNELNRLYRQAADELRAALPELETLGTDCAYAAGLARLTALKSCALNIGFVRLVQIVEQAQTAAAAKNVERVKTLIERLPAALRLLIMQAGGEMRLVPAAEPVAPPERSDAVPVASAPAVETPTEPVAAAES